MIEIKVEGIKEAKDSLRKILHKLQDVDKPLNLVGLHMMKSVDDNFREEGRPDKWAPLSEMTKKMRRGNPPYMIMQDTGNLRRSITMEVGKNSVKVGTSAPYAKKLHFGGYNIMPAHDVVPVKKKALSFIIGGRRVFAKKVHIPTIRSEVPPRPFIVVQDDDIEVIGRIFNDWIGDILPDESGN